MNPRKKSVLATILLALLVVSCATAFTPPPSWTLRKDGRVRASQRGENFSISEFIEKVKKEEGNEYALVVTPEGEAKISRELRYRQAEITRLKNELQDCRNR